MRLIEEAYVTDLWGTHAVHNRLSESAKKLCGIVRPTIFCLQGRTLVIRNINAIHIHKIEFVQHIHPYFSVRSSVGNCASRGSLTIEELLSEKTLNDFILLNLDFFENNICAWPRVSGEAIVRFTLADILNYDFIMPDET